jgi:hypothetical protein
MQAVVTFGFDLTPLAQRTSFPGDVAFQLTLERTPKCTLKHEVVTIGDHLRNQKYSAVNRPARTAGARFEEDAGDEPVSAERRDLRSQFVTSSSRGRRSRKPVWTSLVSL